VTTRQRCGVVAGLDPPTAPADLPGTAEGVIDWLIDPERRGELYPLFHRLRDLAPVHRSAAFHGAAWILSRHDDAEAVFRNAAAVNDPATVEFFNHGGAGGPFYQSMKNMMLFLETGPHAHIRRIVARAFTPRSIAVLRPLTTRVTESLIDSVQADGGMDYVSQYAYQVPFRVIAHILGVPEADFGTVERYAWDYARAGEPGTDAATAASGDAAALGFGEYFTRLIELRRTEPTDDVTSALIHLEEDGRHLRTEQLIATMILLMQAGHETTSDLLGNSLVALFRHPEQLDRLRREPAITVDAVEELLRYDTSVQTSRRLLLEDMRIGEVVMPAGDLVLVLEGAANRDPARYADPDRLDLGRQVRQHLAFALGTYYCIGNALARAEIQIGLRTLLDRLPGIRPAKDTFRWRTTLQAHGPLELEVAW